MARDFEVEVGRWEGVDVERIVSEELFGAATRAQQAWQENLRRGVGAKGSHGRPYVDTGSTLNDIVVRPQEAGASSYETGGDVVSLAVSEFGRRPGRPPPLDAIAAWAKRVGLTPDEGQTFESMCWSIAQAIGARGLPGFAPGQRAFDEVTQGLDQRIRQRLERAHEDAARR